MKGLLVVCLAFLTANVVLADEMPLSSVKFDWSKLTAGEQAYKVSQTTPIDADGKISGAFKVNGMRGASTEVKGDQVVLVESRDMNSTHSVSTYVCSADNLLSLQSGSATDLMMNGRLLKATFEVKEAKAHWEGPGLSMDQKYPAGTLNEVAVSRMVQLLPHTPATYTFERFSNEGQPSAQQPKDGQTFSLVCAGPDQVKIGDADVAVTRFVLNSPRPKPIIYYVGSKGALLMLVDPASNQVSVTASPEALSAFRKAEEVKRAAKVAERKLAEAREGVTKAIPFDKVVGMVKALVPDAKELKDDTSDGDPSVEKGIVIASADNKTRIRVGRVGRATSGRFFASGDPVVVQDGVYVICGDRGWAVAEPLAGQIKAGWQALLPAEK